MKRKTLKFIACAAAMSLMLSVTACGGSDDSSNAPNVEDTADTSEDTAEPEEIENEVEAEEEVPEDAEEVLEDETEVEEEVEEGVSEDKAEVEEEEEDDSEEALTLEELFSDPTLKNVYDSMLEAMSEDDISLSYEVSGNDFVMIFTITDRSLATDEMAEALTDALETQGDQFKTQAAQFDTLLEGDDTCTVTVRYTDPDGNVMAEKTYAAD